LFLLQSDNRILFAIAGAALSGSALLWWALARKGPPLDRERRRRLKVNQHKRTTEAFVTDFEDGVLHYRYEVRGVTYFASQETSGLEALLPEDHNTLIGPVSAKYDPRNPANSIVLCEDWSGLGKRV